MGDIHLQNVCAEYKKLQTNSDTQRQRYSDLLRHS